MLIFIIFKRDFTAEAVVASKTSSVGCVSRESTDCVPCFVALSEVADIKVATTQTTKIRFDEAFVFLEGARNCKEFSVTGLRVIGKEARCQAF
jgi:hypothetical protein